MAIRMQEMPLRRLKERAKLAGQTLREARRRLGTVDGIHAIDAALDEAARLLPGLMERSDGAAMRAVGTLTPPERRALAELLREGARTLCNPCGSSRGAQLAEVLGRYSSHELLEAIDRAEVHEALAIDVMVVLRALEQEGTEPCRPANRAAEPL